MVGIQTLAYILRDLTEDFLELTAFVFVACAGIFPCHTAVEGISSLDGFDHFTQRDFFRWFADFITALGSFKGFDNPRSNQLAKNLQ